MTELRKLTDQFQVVPILEHTVHSTVPSQSDKPALPASILPLPAPAAIEDDKQLQGESDLDPVLDDEELPANNESDLLDPPDDHPNASTHLPHPAAILGGTSDKIAADDNASSIYSIHADSVITTPYSNNTSPTTQKHPSIDTAMTQQHPNNHQLPQQQRPTRGVKHTGSTTSIDAINSYVGLSNMDDLNGIKKRDSIIPPSQQLQNQNNFNQAIYDQSAPKTTSEDDDDNSSDGFYSVTNEDFDKTIDNDDELVNKY